MAKSSTTWKKGQSGNPKGAPKKADSFSTILENALKNTEKTIIAKGKKMVISGEDMIAYTYVEIMNDEENPPNVRLTAANSIADRLYGKPAQSIEVDGEMKANSSIMDLIQYNKLNKLQKDNLEDILKAQND